MKVWVLFFVAVVWMQLPAQGSTKSLGPAVREMSLSPRSKVIVRLGPAVREMSPIALSEFAKRLFKREDSSSSEELDLEDIEELTKLLDDLSDAIDLFANNQDTIDRINEMVDNDDEIDEEDKATVKALTIMILGGDIDAEDEDDDDDVEDVEERALKPKNMFNN